MYYEIDGIPHIVDDLKSTSPCVPLPSVSSCGRCHRHSLRSCASTLHGLEHSLAEQI